MAIGGFCPIAAVGGLALTRSLPGFDSRRRARSGPRTAGMNSILGRPHLW